jgi:hypothetical protein|nr:MAG TPA: hypothetical protein [Caudoviricetes sp.]
MNNVNETLKERGKVYGDYKGGSFFRSVVMRAIIARHAEVNHGGMPDIYMVYLYDIVNKLSRLASTPDHIDTWHDIAGYATLVEEALKKDKENETKQECHNQELDDDAYIKDFMDLVATLTGEDSEITKMTKEAYEEYKKDKENEQGKN